MKTYVVGTHLKCFDEVLLISTYNICFHLEKENYWYFFVEKSAPTGAMGDNGRVKIKGSVQ